MLYTLFRPLLFSLDAEAAHHLTFNVIKYAQKFRLFPQQTISCTERRVMGLDFTNPIGLAAGLDKNGEFIDALATLGFGFIEVGTVTPRPQPGNPQPRIFRIPEAQAVINRLGFNNHGVDKLLENIQCAQYSGLLGINIGKNFDTPLEKAADDYLICLRKVYLRASYITVNISSPNTKNLRQLQNSEELDHLLAVLKQEQCRLADQYGKYTPIAVKIAPDLDVMQIQSIALLLIKHKIDGVIATNTTLTRLGVSQHALAQEQGGLSGAPLTQISTGVIRQLNQCLQGAIPIIGAGGIMSGENAQEKINAGASLIQIYTGLIYRGPGLVKDIAKVICHSNQSQPVSQEVI